MCKFTAAKRQWCEAVRTASTPVLCQGVSGARRARLRAGRCCARVVCPCLNSHPPAWHPSQRTAPCHCSEAAVLARRSGLQARRCCMVTCDPCLKLAPPPCADATRRVVAARREQSEADGSACEFLAAVVNLDKGIWTPGEIFENILKIEKFKPKPLKNF